MTELEYYDLNNTLSRGALLSFVLGHRNAGKTYAFKEWALQDWISNRAEFVYTRRLDSETKTIKKTLFDDISYKFGKTVKARGDHFYIRNNRPMDLDGKELSEWEQQNPWEIFGYSMSINLQQDYKSGTWPKVNKLCFDEFIIENRSRHYLDDEPSQFANLCSTIFRERKAKIVAFSNAGAMWNPYFNYYDISSSDLKQDFIKRNKGAVIFEQYRNQGNIEHLKKGLMGQIGSDEYIRYAIESKFKDVDDLLIIDKSMLEFTSHYCNFYSINDKPFILSFTKSGFWYLHSGKVKNLRSFSLVPQSYKHEYNRVMVNSIQERFFRKLILFDSIDTRMEVLKSIGL